MIIFINSLNEWENMKNLIVLIMFLLFSCMSLGDYDKALSDYAQGINTEEALVVFQAFQDMPLAGLKTGECYYRLGQFAKAIPLLEEYLEGGPFISDGDLTSDDIVKNTRHKVAHAYRMLGQLDIAKPLFESFVNDYPNDNLHENALEALTMCIIMSQTNYDKQELLDLCNQFTQRYPNSDLVS